MENVAKALTIPHHRIFQVAYVVPDLELAIQQFARELNLGAWVVLEKMEFAELNYRGNPSAVRFGAAMACSGDIMYELIQQFDDLPSIYLETVSASGYGFHHFAKLVPSMDAEVNDYRARGFDLAMDLRTSNGARVGFVDTRKVLPGMMEIIEFSEAVMEFIRLPYQAARELGPAGPSIARY